MSSTPAPSIDVHVMIDLETLSLRRDAAIIQVAALVFEATHGALSEGGEPIAFNRFVDGASGYVDPGKVAWWMQNPAAARVGAGMAKGDRLCVVLAALREWVALLATKGMNVVGVWSHGATFDLALLAHANEVEHMPAAWSYKLERDTRTLYALTPGGMPDVGPADPAREHDAAYDCERQVATLVEAFKRIRESGAVCP